MLPVWDIPRSCACKLTPSRVLGKHYLDPMQVSTPPTVTYALVCKSLSRNRFAAYSLDADRDASDAVARYAWNMALSAAFGPILHTLEVAFRNALFEIGNEATSVRSFHTRSIGSWLDATPSMLGPREERDVVEAVIRLGKNRRRHTPGHLVGQLGFGFWVRLCDSPYEQGNSHGPGLWPLATRRFPGCPRGERTRARIRAAFSEVRDFRNEVAHHQPIWDKHVLDIHQRAIDLLSWMNPRLGAVIGHQSRVPALYNEGPGPWRELAEGSFVASGGVLP